MKIIRLTCALAFMLCAATQANVVVDIYRDQFDTFNGYSAPRMTFNELAGSFQMDTPSWSPALDFNLATYDWHPFGLSWFRADIHGTLDMTQPGTGSLLLAEVGQHSFSQFSVDGHAIALAEAGAETAISLTLNSGQHNYELTYVPGQSQQLVNGGRDVITLPDGVSGLRLSDLTEIWKPGSATVPENGAWCWLALPLVLLVRRLRRKTAVS